MEKVCIRPAPGPGYWDFRCLNCSQPIDAHPPLWRRLLMRAGISRYQKES